MSMKLTSLLLAFGFASSILVLAQAQPKFGQLELLNRLKVAHLSDFAIAPRDNSIVIESGKGEIIIKDAMNGKETARFNDGLENPSSASIAISASGQYMAVTANPTKGFRKLNLFQFGKLIQGIRSPSADLPDGDVPRGLPTLQFSADEKVLYAPTFQNAEDANFGLLSVPKLKKIPLPGINQNSGLTFTGSSKFMLQTETLYGKNDKHRLSMIAIKSGNPIWVGNWRNGSSSQIVFSPDASIFARQLEGENNLQGGKSWAGIGSIDSITGQGKGWFKTDWYENKNLGGEKWLILDSIAPGNRILLTHFVVSVLGCDPWVQAKLFDLQLRQEIVMPTTFNPKETEDCHPPVIKFSPDGRYIMVWSENHIDVWGMKDRRSVFKGN